MKKRILSVALAAAMVLSLTLAGCGSSDGGEKQGGNGKLVGVAMRRRARNGGSKTAGT